MERLWTADFVLNLLTAHFLFASFTALYTLIPPYVLHRGGQEWQIGVVIGSFGVVSLVVRAFAGRWISRFGAKRVAIVGAAVFAIAGVLYIPATNVWLLLQVRMLQGVGMALLPVATSTIVANLAPATRRAEALSYMGNSIAVSYLYSPVLAFWLMTEFDFPIAFLFSAASALLASATALRMSVERTGGAGSRASVERMPLVNRKALFPTSVFLTYTLTTAPVATFLPLLAENRDLGNPRPVLHGLLLDQHHSPAGGGPRCGQAGTVGGYNPRPPVDQRGDVLPRRRVGAVDLFGRRVP